MVLDLHRITSILFIDFNIWAIIPSAIGFVWLHPTPNARSPHYPNDQRITMGYVVQGCMDNSVNPCCIFWIDLGIHQSEDC